MKCPICEGEHLDSTDLDFVNEELFEYMVCTDCNATWTNVWRYVGREDINESE